MERNRVIQSFYLLLLCLVLTACSKGPFSLVADLLKGSSLAECQDQPVVRVLFIGNQITSANGLADIFTELACAQGRHVEVHMHAAEGQGLKEHFEQEETKKVVASQQWDFVILQDLPERVGMLLSEVRIESLPSAVGLSKWIYSGSPNATLIYMVNWGLKKGDKDNCASFPRVCSFAGHTFAIEEGYGLYRRETGGRLAQVGLAWKAVWDDARTTDMMRSLWQDDIHPTFRGSYLAAHVIYTTLFQESTLDSDYRGGLSLDEAKYYQAIAVSR